MIIWNLITILPVAMLIAYVIISRSRYKNRPKGEPFFFVDDKLVLDAVLRMHVIPISDIDHVEVNSSSYSMPYIVTINVIKKNGKSKACSYMGYTSLSDMAEALEKRGIYCKEIHK
ncbi:MAG: hypothetical protein K2N95_00745 [Lachnospiraceae bacterium]|nr:hypothetical protein [Lachnospiraceae bacterium]